MHRCAPPGTWPGSSRRWRSRWKRSARRAKRSDPESTYWADALLATVQSHKRDAQLGVDADEDDPLAVAAARLRLRLETLANRAVDMFNAMEFGSCSTRTGCCSRSAIASTMRAWIRISTICSPPKRGCELHRHRQGRRARKALVPARPYADALARRIGADLLVGIDVRISDAVAGDARAPGSLLAETNRLVVRRPARLWRRARRAVGHLRIGVQRARHRADLSIFELRRARSRLQARAFGEHRHRALCHRAGRDGRSGTRGAQTWTASPTKAGGAPMAGTRRSTTRHSACRGRQGRDRALLHGASPGDEPDRHRQCAEGRRDARALPCRTDDAGGRAPAAGAHAARRRGGTAAARAGRRDDRDRDHRAGRAAPLHLALQPAAAHASSVQRRFQRDALGRRFLAIRAGAMWR